MNAVSPQAGTLQCPNAADLAAIAAIVHDATGIVIAQGKESMVQSRLGKRLRALGMTEYSSYLALVQSPHGAEEMARMLSALTTNVTSFFRESHHFEHLRSIALPPLIARARAGGKVRIWSAGCSNGQEPYSVAMVIADMAADIDRLDIRILATDIDAEIIAIGSAASYDSAAADPVSPDLRKRFLTQAGGKVTVSAAVRNLVHFRTLNLHSPWPMQGRFDIIMCRNVVIYFDAAMQAALWQRFEAALAPGGWLYVGHSERVATGAGSRLRSSGITTYRLPETLADRENR
jgi:chemotaxis protein methyltransferase CheR